MPKKITLGQKIYKKPKMAENMPNLESLESLKVSELRAITKTHKIPITWEWGEKWSLNKHELIQAIKTFFNSNASAASGVAEGAVPQNQQQGFVRFDKMNTGDLENYVKNVL